MKQRLSFVFIIHYLLLTSVATAQQNIKVSTPLPLTGKGPGLGASGLRLGTSALYAGTIGDWVVMAGGANFAEKPVAEGGKKCFYSDIYVARATDSLSWHRAGSLPEPMAYGTAVVSNDRLIVIGGSNTTGSLADVCSIDLACCGEATVNRLASLPIALDNTAGCIYNNKVYVGGGLSNGTENHKVFCLDLNLDNPAWEETTDFLGRPAVQSVACISDGKPLFIGGFSPKTEEHEAEVFDGPSGGALAQAPDGTVYIVGGVNHEIFLDAISGCYEKIRKENYLLQSPEWYRFDQSLRKYNPCTGTYTEIMRSPDLARAGCSLVYADGRLYVIHGEIKPGIRTNKSTTIKL